MRLLARSLARILPPLAAALTLAWSGPSRAGAASSDAVSARARGALVLVGSDGAPGSSAQLGALVSRDGLLWTTRAAVAGCLTEADHAGFVARAVDDERACPGQWARRIGTGDDEGRWDDVRLVFAPEASLAVFGGPATAIEFPRASVEIVLLRVWEAGRPARVTRFLPLSARGPVDGDPVIAPGQARNRALQVTPERLVTERDALLPFEAARLRVLSDALAGDARATLAGERRAQLVAVERRLAEVEGRLALLRDPVRIAEANRRHADLLIAMHDLPPSVLSDEDEAEAARAINRLDAAWRRAAVLLPRLAAATSLGPAGALWELAAADPDHADLAVRVDGALEVERLAWGLESLRLALPARDPLIEGALRGKTARARAEELVRTTALVDPARRATLFSAVRARRADPKAPAVDDPLVALRAQVDARKAALSEEAAREVFTDLGLAASRLAPVEDALRPEPPAPTGATLGVGTVRGTATDGKHVHWAVTVGDLFATDRRARGAPDRSLPERWRAALTRVDFSMPLVFQAELADTRPSAGGPLVSTDGLALGLVVGLNRAALADDVLVARGDGRAVAISSNGLLHALDRVYDAKHLVDELLSSAADR